MKILQLGKFYPVRGGVERVMHDLATGLSERGVCCDMMCAESVGAGGVSPLGGGSRLITHRTWVKAASTTIAPSMIARLRREAPQYDIVHVHHPDPMAALALRLSGYRGRVVLHWHSDIVKQRRLLRLYMPLQRWLIGRADVIVGTSPEYVRCSEALKASASKTVCVPIGIRPLVADEAGASAVRARHGGRRIVFFMGRLIGYKGLEHLVDAAAMLPEGYTVLIGGEGPLLEPLQRRIDSAGLGDRVTLLGRLPDHETAAYYTACDVFCLPSVMRTEAFGIVQLEAMSLGRPVIATTIPGSGTGWVNSHGVSGLNVPPGDPGAIARAVLDITSDPARHAAFCAGALDRYRSEFRFETMIDRCLDIYSGLLSK